MPEKAATLGPFGAKFVAPLHRDARDSWSCVKKAATASHIERHGVPNQDAPGVAFAEQPELVPEKAATLGRHFIAMLESRDSWSCARKAATAGHISLMSSGATPLFCQLLLLPRPVDF